MRRIMLIAFASLAALTLLAGVATPQDLIRTEEVSATFQARSIGDSNVKTCRAPDGTYSRFEADFAGSLVAGREEELDLVVRGFEVLANQETGLGAVEAKWALRSADGTKSGSGELIAVFISGVVPPDPDFGEVDGMFLGDFGDPGGSRRVLWNFSAQLTDGGRTLTGAIGDPTLAPNPAILFPPDPC